MWILVIQTQSSGLHSLHFPRLSPTPAQPSLNALDSWLLNSQLPLLTIKSPKYSFQIESYFHRKNAIVCEFYSHWVNRTVGAMPDSHGPHLSWPGVYDGKTLWLIFIYFSKTRCIICFCGLFIPLSVIDDDRWEIAKILSVCLNTLTGSDCLQQKLETLTILTWRALG